MALVKRKKTTQPKLEPEKVIRLETIRPGITAQTASPKPNWWLKLRWLGLALFGLACIVAVSFVLLWRFEYNAVYSQQPGEAAKDDIVAPKALTYVSQVQTQKAADEAARNSANNVYRRDDSIVSQQRENLNNFISLLDKVRQNNSALNEPAIKAANLSEEQLERILNVSNSQWEVVGSEARNAYNSIISLDIRPENLPNEVTRLKNYFYTSWNLGPTFARLDDNSRALVIGLVQPFIQANTFIDAGATKVKQDEARKRADPVSVNIVKGQSIVRRGEILTPLQIEQSEQLGLRSSRDDWQSMVGTIGVVTALVLLMAFYLIWLHKTIWTHPRMLLFIGAALVMAAAGMRLFVADYAEHPIRPYILPLAAISMVLAALLDVNLALFFTAILALLSGYVAHSPEMAAVFFVGGAAGAFTLFKAERTISFAYAGLAVAFGQFAVALCFDLALNSVTLTSLGLLLLINLANGLVATSLAFFTFSALGKLFGVTTVIQLLELAHPNQPLLRRLMREAPGTYHHSILVSNLAEQAAEHLMGDALLARVGAYYHDIGKLSRPSNFIDNQGGGSNIHDTLDPRESIKLIRAHVEDGVVLAKKNHLPRKVVDIIHQHHGTCLISYFYSKAVSLGLDVNEIDFRYPGPKPQTKVAAIVMLSDGVEAAVRANVQSGRIPTVGKPAVPAHHDPATSYGPKELTITDVVNKIIDDRIRDHQLDECDLTLRDIDELRHLFVEILAGIYHPRINYPEPMRPASKPEEKPQAVEGIVVNASEPAEKEAVGANITTLIISAKAGLGEEHPVTRRSLNKGGIGNAGRLIGPGESSKN